MPIFSGWRRNSDIPLVATNDSHYLCEDDHHAHEVLLCVQTAGSIHDPKRFKFDSDQFYVKTAEEMERLFAHAPAGGEPHDGVCGALLAQAAQGGQSVSGFCCA